MQSVANSCGVRVEARPQAGARGISLLIDAHGREGSLRFVSQHCNHMRRSLRNAERFNSFELTESGGTRCQCIRLSDAPARAIDAHREKVLSLSNNNRVIIIIGPTGCGKSTGVPAIFLNAPGMHLRRICCTEPRRVAAAALANHVAEQSNVRLGDVVGYAIGGVHEYRKGHTELTYMTTAIAMLQFLSDYVGYTHLIVDEVHERSVFVDILLTIVKLHHLKVN